MALKPQIIDQEARHCADIARSLDYDRYLCALFAPEAPRQALFALLAFNAEIARTREVVSEPILGAIRLQWWREALDGAFAGAPARQPLVQKLAETIGRFGLSRGPFEALLRARERDLDDAGFADMPALIGYIDDTAGALSELMLQALDARGPQVAAAGQAAARAWGLTGLLRAVAFHAMHRRFLLPRDRLAGAKVTVQEVIDGHRPPGLALIVAGLAGEARQYLRQARSQRGGLPRAALPALLPASLADGYLARLAKFRYDVFDPRLDLPPLSRQLRLAWKASLRRF